MDSTVVQEFPMFHTGEGKHQVECWDEFDDAREVVSSLSSEYEACESPDYIERPRMGTSSAAEPLTAAADARIPVA